VSTATGRSWAGPRPSATGDRRLEDAGLRRGVPATNGRGLVKSCTLAHPSRAAGWFDAQWYWNSSTHPAVSIRHGSFEVRAGSDLAETFLWSFKHRSGIQAHRAHV
jgi:hypothetical protein